MARQPGGNPPAYPKKAHNGQARITVRLIDGRRRDLVLGPFRSAASRTEYARVLAELEANGGYYPLKSETASSITINELILLYWQHAERYYRKPDGTASSEQHCLKAALRPLKELYGSLPAVEFRPLALEAVRGRMVQLGWCRRSINLHVSRLKSMFKWAVSKELVPPSVHHGLLTVAGLRLGRSGARETGPVRPVPEAFVEATLPHVNRVVRGMIEVQQHTGMRPGEVCRMRACDIDMTGAVWLFKPDAHKTAHHGHQRVVAIGPRAQQIIKPFLTLNTSAYLFRPAEAMDDPLWAERRKPGERYTVGSYRQAIERGCDRAFPAPAPLGKAKDETFRQWRKRLSAEQKAELRAWQRAHRWHPHQLRHTKATEIRREFGLDEARAVLGHKSATVAEVYAELDTAKAAEVMERLG